MNRVLMMNSATGTLGTGNTILRVFEIDHNVLQNSEIKSFEEFLRRCSGKSDPKCNTTKIILEDLKNKLEEKYSNSVDPVQYLIYLYFKEQLSIRRIVTKLNKMGLKGVTYYKIRILFKDKLGFNLRDNNETTPSKRRIGKINSKEYHENINKENKRIIEEILANKRKINNIISFNIEEYNNLKFTYQKIIYLLYHFGFIENNSIIGLKDFINSLKEKGLGKNRISKILSHILNEEIIKKHNLKIKEIKFSENFPAEVLKIKS